MLDGSLAIALVSRQGLRCVTSDAAIDWRRLPTQLHTWIAEVDVLQWSPFDIAGQPPVTYEVS